MLLLRNADVYAPRPLGLQSLLIGGGSVLWMGPGKELPSLPPVLGAITNEVDLAGLRLIPGLVDAHVHVTGGGGEAGFRTRVPPVPLTRFTLAGVTTVVGLLGTDDVTRGPRDLLATIYALREEGLNAYGYAGGYHVPLATLDRTACGATWCCSSLCSASANSRSATIARASRRSTKSCGSRRTPTSPDS